MNVYRYIFDGENRVKPGCFLYISSIQSIEVRVATGARTGSHHRRVVMYTTTNICFDSMFIIYNVYIYIHIYIYTMYKDIIHKHTQTMSIAVCIHYAQVDKSYILHIYP